MHREVPLLVSRARQLARRLSAFARGPGGLPTILIGLALAGTVSADTVTYTYDEGGRLKLVTYDNGSKITYTLDAAGNRKSVVQSLDTTAPVAPTGLAGSSTSATNIHLTWNQCTDTSGSLIEGYDLYRDTATTPIYTGSATSTDDPNVVYGSTHNYAVDCFDNAGNHSPKSTPTVPVTVTDHIAPPIPAGLTGSAPASGTVNLSWSAVVDTGGSGLKGYNIYRGGTKLNSTAITTLTYTDSSTLGSTAYSYAVSAIDNAGNESAHSTAFPITTPDTIAPPTPGGLTGSAPASGTVNLTWTSVVDTGGSNLAGYNIYRNTVKMNTTGPIVSAAYTDSTTVGTTTYNYTVSAIDHSNNESPQSAAFPITTPDTIAPPTPGGLTGSAPTSLAVNLSWAAVVDTGGSGLKGYNIYRNGGLLSPQAPPVASPTFTDSTTTCTTAYTYTVAAVDNANNASPQSGPFSITTPDTVPPTVPTGLTATLVGGSQVNLSWNASTDCGTGVIAYFIYRDGSLIYGRLGTATTYSDSPGGGTFTYTVVAVDNGQPDNESAPSLGATVTVPPSIPSIPGTPAPSGKLTTTSWTESWAASTGPVSYYTLQQLMAGVLQQSWTIPAPTTSSAQSGSNGSRYQYQVQACNSSNQCSGFSPTSSVNICQGGVCP